MVIFELIIGSQGWCHIKALLLLNNIKSLFLHSVPKVTAQIQKIDCSLKFI